MASQKNVVAMLVGVMLEQRVDALEQSIARVTLRNQPAFQLLFTLSKFGQGFVKSLDHAHTTHDTVISPRTHTRQHLRSDFKLLQLQGEECGFRLCRTFVRLPRIRRTRPLSIASPVGEDLQRIRRAERCRCAAPKAGTL